MMRNCLLVSIVAVLTLTSGCRSAQQGPWRVSAGTTAEWSDSQDPKNPGYRVSLKVLGVYDRVDVELTDEWGGRGRTRSFPVRQSAIPVVVAASCSESFAVPAGDVEWTRNAADPDKWTADVRDYVVTVHTRGSRPPRISRQRKELHHSTAGPPHLDLWPVDR